MDQLLGRKKVMGVIETVRMLAREETRLEDKTEFVSNLILNFGFTDDQAAKAASVTIAFVRKIKASLAKDEKH